VFLSFGWLLDQKHHDGLIAVEALTCRHDRQLHHSPLAANELGLIGLHGMEGQQSGIRLVISLK